MKYQQIIRIDKIFNEPIYLLGKNHNNNKYIFEICGSTKNIYKVQIYNLSGKIFCNCPDAKSYAKQNGVICKHACFIILKVLKISNSNDFFKTLLFNSNHLNEIKDKYNSLQFIENDYINLEYINKFNNIDKNKNNKEIILKESFDKECPICYDELLDITNINFNKQCNCCLKIFHNECLNKWINLGKSNCPYCRTIINNNSDYQRLD